MQGGVGLRVRGGVVHRVLYSPAARTWGRWRRSRRRPIGRHRLGDSAAAPSAFLPMRQFFSGEERIPTRDEEPESSRHSPGWRFGASVVTARPRSVAKRRIPRSTHHDADAGPFHVAGVSHCGAERGKSLGPSLSLPSVMIPCRPGPPPPFADGLGNLQAFVKRDALPQQTPDMLLNCGMKRVVLL